MNLCWGIFKWGLLIGVVGVVVGVPYFYDQLDSEIRQRMESLLSEHYPELEVSVRSAQFIEDEGIDVRDLVIVEKGAKGPRAELIHVPEIRILARGNLQELLSGGPDVHEIIIRRPVLRITRRHDGTWSAARLLPLPRFDKRPPKVRIEGATIEIFDPTKNPSSSLALRNVNLTLSDPDAAAAGGEDAHTRRIDGTLEGDHIGRAEVHGLINPHTRRWSLSGLVEGCQLTQESLRSLPSDWLEGRRLPGRFQSRVTFQYKVSGGAEGGFPCHFQVSGRLAEGRIEDARLPGPVTELEADFQVDNEGLTVTGAAGRIGQSAFAIHSLRTWGFDSASRKSIDVQVQSLELNRDLLAVLPDDYRETWSKYLPSGRVNIAACVAEFDGQKWRPQNMTIECVDVSFSYYKFPYRLYRARGNLRLQSGVLAIGIEAFSGNQLVQISGSVAQFGGAPSGEVIVRAGELDLSDELFEAMEPGPREVVESLRAQGKVSLYLRIWNETPGTPARKHLVANVLGGSIRYDRFPYPLQVHGGQIEMIDGEWSFRDFRATNGTGVVFCGGSFGQGEQGKQLLLRFRAANVALEEELRDALGHPNMQRLWSGLRIRGTADIEDLTVRYCAEPRELSVSFRAIPHPDTTSIESVQLPYRLEKLRGILVYDNGRVAIDRFSGQHGEARLTARVHCEFLPDESWKLFFEDLAVEQLPLDNELIRILPTRIRSAAGRLNAEGPINLRGRVEVARSADAPDRLVAKWDTNVVFHRARIDCGAKLEEMSGAVHFVGTSDGARFACRGELDVDSMVCNGIQVTQLTGPIWIDGERVLLGASVSPQEGDRQRSLSGLIFGGRVFGDGSVSLGDVPSYRLMGRLAEADLARTAQELLSGRQALRGKVFANVEVWGQGRSLNSLAGRGNIRLRDADIYKFPLMISLLKILSIREPDKSAFSESDIDFVIEGDHIYLTRINFKGDAISLEGAGEMDFNRNLNLTFGTRLGRGDRNLPVLRELLGNAGDQIVVIHVEGPASDPKIVRQPLPAMNRMIEQLQKDLQIPVQTPGVFPDFRAWEADRRTSPGRH